MQVNKNNFSFEDDPQKKISKKKVDDLFGQLSEEQKGRVENILSDENKLRELLNSPAAKKIMDNLKGKA